MVVQDVADHQPAARRLGKRDELGALPAVHSERLLDEKVLAGLDRPPPERQVLRGRQREDDALDRRIGQHLVEAPDRHAVLGRDAPGGLRILVDHRRERADLGMVAGVVPAPDADADDGDLGGIVCHVDVQVPVRASRRPPRGVFGRTL